MGGNFNYICSTPGILKIISVVIVFFSQGLIFWGYQNASYIYGNYEQGCINQRDSGLPFLKDRYCPIAQGVTWSMIIAMISFWASLIMLIVHLIWELNKTFFKLIDWIGHFAGGLMMMIAGILSIVYSIQAYYDQPCNKDCEKVAGLCVVSNEQCANNRAAYYQPLWVLIGGICAIGTGLVYIGTGIAIRKQPSS